MDALVDSMFKFVEQPMLLQGNFAPVNEIGETVVVPSIEGEIPKDFPEGVYIRNGPNPIFADKTAAISIFGKSTLLWFEGDGMLHATYFSKDERENWVVTYKNRYVEAETFMVEKEKKKALFLPATEGDSSAVVAAYILNLLRFGKVNKDLNNTNLFKHAGKVYSITENHMPYEVDVSNLETLNDWELKDAWNRPFTSHPKVYMKTGEMVAMGIDAKKPYYVLGIISADGKKLIHKVDLKFEKSTLSHDLGVTENYNIIIDYPLIIDVGRLIRGGSLIKYERDQRARIGVMPRYGDVESVIWFSIKNHCTFHIINSFEEGDEVVVIGCRAIGSIFPGPDHGTNKQEWFRRAFRPVSAVTEGFDPSVDGVVFPRPYEWRLNVKTGAVKEGYLTGTNFAMDFPTINDTFMGMKNKYCYTQVLDSVQSSKTGLSAFNLFAKLYFEERKKPVIKEGEDWIKVEYHVLEENQFCSGLHFIPKPGGIDEDDGSHN
ncbi:carotenoid 9,10(9',10')-cleavage dioxygenase-like [Magnolia sinica]|uniref:carotenoid 9,10(9',10')-cleavage dioxygenase-like n=1 Tax=Magnolia sinica TaxID=86752 RepID=UPI0026593DCB|nr:carotenoid 9,10(9',10')-cleavage dioxygenase-like [Magnolia sinica]